MRVRNFLIPLVMLIVWISGHSVLAQTKRIVIAGDTLFDGKGHVLRNTRIVVEGSKIVAIDPKAGPVDYDLRNLQV